MSVTDKSITLGEPRLAPIAWLDFASRYPDQAKTIEATTPAETDTLMKLLTKVNNKVNRDIIPKMDAPGQDWRIWPRSGTGDCTDYVVTKRAELIKRGVPASALLIAEVVTPEDEPHAVLVARTTNGDYVLDNLNPAIYPWNETGYQWVRMQTPKNPNFWKTVVV